MAAQAHYQMSQLAVIPKKMDVNTVRVISRIFHAIIRIMATAAAAQAHVVTAKVKLMLTQNVDG